MRKAVTRGDEPENEGKGRRYWVRAHPSEPKALAEGAPKRAPKARFLEPYRLSEERRGALLDCLIAAGVGDPESRDLFATAVEYDIASFRQSVAGSDPGTHPQPVLEPPSEPAVEAVLQPAQTPLSFDADQPSGSSGAQTCPPASDLSLALTPVAEAARVLAGLIVDLGPADRSALAAALQAADPYRRGYDRGYLEALCGELERIGGARLDATLPPTVSAEPPARSVAESVAAPGESTEPPLSVVGRRFVLRVARIYEQCLEARPAVDPEGPFFDVIQVLATEAGVRLPIVRGALAAILGDP